jgi:hypothetical protein
MTAIQKAIAAIDSQDAKGQLSYRAAAKRFGVNRTTLSRHHRGIQTTNAGAHQNAMHLSPQQEKELVGYIKGLTDKALPPTREMIRNFASAVSKWEVSDAWVTRFLRRNDAQFTSKLTTGMDRNRHKADSEYSYRLYFELLHEKIREYDVDVGHIYNMDEKGFMIGVTSRTKRVFSKQLWQQKKVTASFQDGNREWITILACVGADGAALDASVVFEGKGALRDAWVHDVEVGKHQVFFTTSPSGWSNKDVGLAWIEQVFDRRTKKKARRRWRLLILDGHGSHLTKDFIGYCHANRILVMVLPPHSTHSLQPLDGAVLSSLEGIFGRTYTVPSPQPRPCTSA